MTRRRLGRDLRAANSGAYSVIKPITIGGTTTSDQTSPYTGVSTVAVQIVKDPTGSATCFDGGVLGAPGVAAGAGRGK